MYEIWRIFEWCEGESVNCDVYIVLRKKERELFQGTPCYYLPSITPNNKRYVQNETSKQLQVSSNKNTLCGKTWIAFHYYGRSVLRKGERQNQKKFQEN